MKLFLIFILIQFKHVYHPDRLRVIAKQKQVTGVITYLKYEKDGDLHIVVNGLVGECICQRSSKIKYVTNACIGYIKKFPLLHKGDKITMSGVYVFDRIHKWREIHPVNRIILWKRLKN